MITGLQGNMSMLTARAVQLRCCAWFVFMLGSMVFSATGMLIIL